MSAWGKVIAGLGIALAAFAADRWRAVDIQGLLISEIRAELCRRDMTQSELAVLVGITDKHMSQLLTGRAVGALPLWSALLTALGITLERAKVGDELCS
jgi:predicted XRE-type DNA-binding protein